MGHLFKEHGNGIHPPSALVFKELQAEWFMNNRRGPGEGRGHRGGRRGGRSGGRSRKDAEREPKSSYEENLGRVDKTDVDMSDPSRKRTNDVVVNETIAVGPEGEALNNSRTTMTGLELAVVNQSSNPVSPPPKRESKRNKTEEDGRSDNLTANILAGSLEGRRRA